MPELAVIPGDGIGREVVPAAVEVLRAVIPGLETVEADAGWDCFQRTGTSVPQETLETIRACGAGLFGAVSSPSRKVEGYQSAVLTLRQELDLYSNIRPVRSLPVISPRDGVNMIIVRENTEGLYSRIERIENNRAVAERVITRQASTRIAIRAVSLAAQLGRRKLTIVHKANVLPVSDGLFRDCVLDVARTAIEAGQDLEVDELLVDVAALKMVAEPERFDVVVTTNLFGDILSDAASYWGGGLGTAPSLNWGEKYAVAEPVHGSAPDIAGQGIANPIAAVLSGAMLARFVWADADAADRIEGAVEMLLREENYAVELASSTSAIRDRLLALLVTE
ncbi:MAG: isocitrate/isopropylmalate dehydrogenase family protein [Anaerolineales bacterium]|nr:isocitrate/isopropylmalate dehydrogenase family protein [Anaerolineales bacterium]